MLAQPRVSVNSARTWGTSYASRHPSLKGTAAAMGGFLKRIALPEFLRLDRRRAVGVEGLDCLQAPGLAFLALLLGPDDRLPVRRQDQARAGVGDFDPVAAGLVDIEEEGLLNRVLVRAGLDLDAVFQENIGGAQDFLAAVQRVGDVVEAAGLAVVVARIG